MGVLLVRDRRGCFVMSLVGMSDESVGESSGDCQRSKMRLSERGNDGAMERRSESVESLGDSRRTKIVVC